VGDILPIAMSERAVVGIVAILDPLLARAAMHDLSRPEGVVATLVKVIHEGLRVLNHLILLSFFKSVEPGGMRVESKDYTGTRWITDWDSTMSLGERNSAIDEPFHVCSLGLGMPTERFNVIIEIITNDENDIRTISSLGKEKKKSWGHKMVRSPNTPRATKI
jgi:hypothetical protein